MDNQEEDNPRQRKQSVQKSQGFYSFVMTGERKKATGARSGD